MVTLGIDTACEYGSVGLAKGNRSIGELTYYAKMSQSEKLLSSIKKLLKITGVKRKELKLVSVSMGPGSFTGLRIGIATAKGLTLSLDIPLVGVPTADSYFRRVSFWTGQICVLISDRRNLVYQALYSDGEKVVDESSLPIEEVLKEAGRSEKTWLFVGTAVKNYRTEIKSTGGITTPTSLNIPSGFNIAMMGHEKFVQNKKNELLELEPLYAQRPVAELKFGKFLDNS